MFHRRNSQGFQTQDLSNLIANLGVWESLNKATRENNFSWILHFLILPEEFIHQLMQDNTHGESSFDLIAKRLEFKKQVFGLNEFRRYLKSQQAINDTNELIRNLVKRHVVIEKVLGNEEDQTQEITLKFNALRSECDNYVIPLIESKEEQKATQSSAHHEVVHRAGFFSHAWPPAIIGALSFVLLTAIIVGGLLAYSAITIATLGANIAVTIGIAAGIFAAGGLSGLGYAAYEFTHPTEDPPPAEEDNAPVVPSSHLVTLRTLAENPSQANLLERATSGSELEDKPITKKTIAENAYDSDVELDSDNSADSTPQKSPR